MKKDWLKRPADSQSDLRASTMYQKKAIKMYVGAYNKVKMFVCTYNEMYVCTTNNLLQLHSNIPQERQHT